jgi:hypothetical protein
MAFPVAVFQRTFPIPCAIKLLTKNWENKKMYLARKLEKSGDRFGRRHRLPVTEPPAGALCPGNAATPAGCRLQLR